MIPNKTVSHKENYTTTDLQRLAQKENFALFTLSGMKGQLNHLYKCESLDPAQTKYLQSRLEYMINEIKLIQHIRKNNRGNKHG